MIRLLKSSDAAEYRALRLEALLCEPSAFLSDFEVERQKDELFLEKSLKLNSDLPFVFGAFHNGMLIGIAGFASGELIQLFVKTANRGESFGGNLTKEVIRHAFHKFTSLQSIKIGVVLKEFNALSLYQKLGFVNDSFEDCTHYGFRVLTLVLTRESWNDKQF